MVRINIGTFGKVTQVRRIMPNKVHIVDLRKRIFDGKAFDNFIDAQNILIAGHTTQPQSFSNVIAVKGKHLQAQERLLGLRFKKGKVI